MPKDQRRTGVILYLHGGGYTCGSLEYAKGFAAALASECGVRVFCPAYRLAPEHPYPAALDDALESYQYLLQKGYEPGQIMLAGESAGGGLIVATALALMEKEAEGTALDYNDKAEISDYAVSAVENLAALEIMNGDENQNFLPRASATRAESAKIVCVMSELAE